MLTVTEIQHVSVNGRHCSLQQHVHEMFITCCYERDIHHEKLKEKAGSRVCMYQSWKRAGAGCDNMDCKALKCISHCEIRKLLCPLKDTLYRYLSRVLREQAPLEGNRGSVCSLRTQRWL